MLINKLIRRLDPSSIKMECNSLQSEGVKHLKRALSLALATTDLLSHLRGVPIAAPGDGIPRLQQTRGSTPVHQIGASRP